jgi:hypothetical protein
MRFPNSNGKKWAVGVGAAVVVIVGLAIALVGGGKPAVPLTSTPAAIANDTPTPGAFGSPLGTPGTFYSPLSPLGTPAPGAFDSPLGTPTPTPVVLYSDDFSDTGSGWQEGSFGDSEHRYEEGEYVTLVKRANLATWSSWPKERFTDFTLEVDVRLVERVKAANMGLVFRLQGEDNFYLFLINSYGQYTVGKNVNGEWRDIAGMKWTLSPYIKTMGATNRLKVVCQGTRIALYANGYHLATVDDDSFAEGKVGLIVATDEYSDPVKVAFDNLVVSVAEDIP